MTQSLGGKRHGMVIMDDYSRFGWVLFIAHKDEAFDMFQKFYNRIQNEKATSIISIRSDHEKEFKNQHFESFYKENGISHCKLQYPSEAISWFKPYRTLRF